MNNSKQSSPHNWGRPDFIPEPVDAPAQNADDEFAPLGDPDEPVPHGKHRARK
jgi:hypothetical protein